MAACEACNGAGSIQIVTTVERRKHGGEVISRTVNYEPHNCDECRGSRRQTLALARSAVDDGENGR